MINMNLLIWIIQGLLAGAFLVGGIVKLTVSRTKVREKVGGWVEDFKEFEVRIIGLLEVLGSLGLILPMVFNTFPILTPIAAGGLGITMVVAAQTHLRRKESIVANVILLILNLFVVLGRLVLVPVI